MSNIEALLQIVQPGMEAGNAFADIISGRVTPSGKMTDSMGITNIKIIRTVKPSLIIMEMWIKNITQKVCM